MKNQKMVNRVKNLKDMDDFVRIHVQDEEIIVNEWLALGVPDCADDDILHFIAAHDENYIECLESFFRCISSHVEQAMEEDL